MVSLWYLNRMALNMALNTSDLFYILELITIHIITSFGILINAIDNTLDFQPRKLFVR